MKSGKGELAHRSANVFLGGRPTVVPARISVMGFYKLAGNHWICKEYFVAELQNAFNKNQLLNLKIDTLPLNYPPPICTIAENRATEPEITIDARSRPVTIQ